MQLLAIPIGGVALVVVGWLWINATPVLKKGTMPHPGVWIAAMLLMFPVHELLHAIVHPEFGMSRKTVLAVWPSRLLCYAHFDGPRSRERLLTGVAMPFLAITVLPLVIALATGHASLTVGFISSLNALAAGGDILGFFILLWQVPRHANVFNQGWRTYWAARS